MTWASKLLTGHPLVVYYRGMPATLPEYISVAMTSSPCFAGSGLAPTGEDLRRDQTPGVRYGALVENELRALLHRFSVAAPASR